jgi:glycosyltransferase involved in cell wall biosynthesis
MGRILILTPTYLPHMDGVAGAARLMAEGLAARGYEVGVVTQLHPERQPSSPGDNPRVYQFDVKGSPTWGCPARGQVEEMRRFIAGFDSDALFCHTLDATPTWLALGAFQQIRAAKALVSHGYVAHQVNWHPGFPWGLGQWLRWQPFVWRLPLLLRRFDRLVFLSRRTDWGRFFDHGVARMTRHQGIRIIPNGVDWRPASGSPADFRKRYGLERKLLFLCVANYCERKNQRLALRAFRRARLPGAALVFIGSEANDYSRLLSRLNEDLRKELPAGEVLILENMGRQMTQQAFGAMDAFVLSANAETQPIVLLESMAASKPFISTNTGCVSELPGGLVVQTEAQLTGALQLLAADPSRRTALGEAGHAEYLAHYQREAVLDAYEELLREIVPRLARST